MSSSPKFEVRSLIIIVPFTVAFLLGCLCICKQKMYLWTLRKDDSESDAGPKVADVTAHQHANKAGELEKDPEAGNMRGNESESDSILIAPDSGKGVNVNRKAFCA